MDFIIIAMWYLLGFMYGGVCALITGKIFNKACSNVIVGMFIPVIAIFISAKDVISIYFVFLFFGVMIGYPYFCKPSKWWYDGLQYHKY